MDLMGPRVKSARGHQCILVSLSHATQYPEALPFWNISSKGVSVFFQGFSRTGLPKEILTDRDPPFMSKIMKEFCKLFKIRHLNSSGYCPQMALAKHGKKKKLVGKRCDWDMLLPCAYKWRKESWP